MLIIKEIYNLLPVKFTMQSLQITVHKTDYFPDECCNVFLFYTLAFGLISENNKNIYIKKNKNLNIDIIFDNISNSINKIPKGIYSSYFFCKYFYDYNLIDDIWDYSNLIEASICTTYKIIIEEDEYLKAKYPMSNNLLITYDTNEIIKEWAKDDFIYKYNELQLLKAQKAISDNTMSNKMNFNIKNVDLNSELGKLIINIINENKSIENKYVYLIYDVNGNSYKFGQTYDLIYRENTLRAKEPKIELIKFCQTNVITESDLKEKYKSKRSRGEWFDLSDDEVNEIKILMNSLCEIDIKK
jgi:hypothetical protein